jgi:16S rRNA (cytosine967-C5)-methyltransferase
VLVDAPCSGLGTLARNPDIRWRCAPRELDRQAGRQRELLESLSALVAPGGRLVYSTCSIEPEENDEVVAPLLDAHPELSAEPLPQWAEPFDDQGFLRIEPAPGRGDAFFAACLRRTA